MQLLPFLALQNWLLPFSKDLPLSYGPFANNIMYEEDQETWKNDVSWSSLKRRYPRGRT